MPRNGFAALFSILLFAAVMPDARSADFGQPARDLTVMTRNMDLGSDFGYIFQAVQSAPNDVNALIGATTATFFEVLASDMPGRARRLAAEIDDTRPDIVSLQEVSRVSVGPFGGSTPTVIEDQLADLLEALAQRGLSYAPLLVHANLNGTLPALDTSFHLIDLTLADFDVVLARSDLPESQLKIEAVHSGYFQAHVTLLVAGRSIDVPHGWIAVDARLRGKRYRVVDTHLESNDLSVQAAEASELLVGVLDADRPVVLAGDLNSDAHAPGFSRGPAYPILVAAGFSDTWAVVNPADPGLTWPMFGEDPPLGPSTPFERIDLMLTRGAGLAPIAAVRTGIAAPFAADHAGVVATFQLLP